MVIFKDKEDLDMFKKIMKKIPPDAEIYVGKGKKEIKLDSIDPKELWDNVQKWCEESKKGLVCGIYGCQEDPEIKCKICNGSYCEEHNKIHFHVENHEGLILREIKEC